jgi:hypothetical protein
MTADKDEWGHDPSVQRMRMVFSIMEKAQTALIKHLELSRFDIRLREIRETARRLFDRAFAATAKKKLSLDEAAITGIYIDALIQAFRRADVPLPDNLNIGSKAFADLTKGVLS